MASFAYLGLDIGSRALFAAQQALDTVAHNIANANTAGYSRQRSVLQATPPISVPTLEVRQQGGQVGTGVEVRATLRLRDAFADSQWRREATRLGQSQTESGALGQVEDVFNEPGDSGLQSLLDKFWGAWHDLGNDPSGAAQRASLVEQGRALTAGITDRYAKLAAIQADQNDQIRQHVANVNSIAGQISALNVQIARVVGTGNAANDLTDQRDMLVDQLAQVLPVTYREQANGMLNVYIQGHTLVDGDQASALKAANNPANNGNVDLTFDDGATFLTASGGQIGGLQKVRDGAVADQITRLDQLAVGLRDAVNAQHRQGYGLDGQTGRDFLAGTGARDIGLSAAVLASPDAIAAAAAGEGTGGTGNSQAMAALQDAVVAVGGGNAKLGDFYRATISALGVASQTAANGAANQQTLVDNLDRQRQSTSGVSLDEETTQMIAYQRAYQAAARLITVTDEMLDKLINGTGVAGR